MQNSTATKTKTHRMVLTAIMTALVFIATFSIKIPVPLTQGYIHIGDSMIFIAVLVLGWKYGAFAAGVGSAFADLFGGYPHWILPTLIIKTMMAVLMGLAIESTKKNKGGQLAFIGIIAIAWATFFYFIKQIIINVVNKAPETLIGELEGVDTMDSLFSFVEKIQGQLVYASIIVPVALVLLGLYVNKKAKINMKASQIIGMTVAGFWMILGYYVASGIMYGSYVISAFSVPWNIVQFVLGFFIAQLIIIALKRTKSNIFQ